MAVLRTDREHTVKLYNLTNKEYGMYDDEWKDGDVRIHEPSWIQRYEYEAKIVADVINEHKLSKAIELGPGPGRLAQSVFDLVNSPLDYTLVDKPHAKEQFNNNKFRGNFKVSDLNNEFDVSGFDTDYDLIIANDFLEHIANPSDCLSKAWDITKDESYIIVSVPNWRMGHTFIYRGLFDYDNWIYTMHIHGWTLLNVMESPLKCNPLPRLSSEEELPQELLNSWNWYFIGKKIQE